MKGVATGAAEKEAAREEEPAVAEKEAAMEEEPAVATDGAHYWW